MIKTNPINSFIVMCCVIFSTVLLSSCGTSRKINTDYLYFRDGMDTIIVQQRERIIQPNDLLSIQVFSRTTNQEQAAIFNLPQANNNLIQSYQVDSAGNIEMPVIGSVKAQGLTKEKLQATISPMLTNYVKNPSVVVRFLEFNVNVLGEVRAPGSKKFTGNRVTIIDAIGEAGDLTDFGMRENVKVIREQDGKKIYYTVDLRNKAIFESTVYLLQPNDIVYVSPNVTKLKSLDIDPVVERRRGLVFSVISIVLSVATIIVYIFR